MGRLLSGSVPNLISGVSQQPWNVRLPTQAEEQVNCYPSVVEFLKRRPASNHVAKLLTANEIPGEAAIVHHISRDDHEQYVVVIAHGQLSVFDLKGNRMILQNTGGNYLGHSNVQPPFKFLTINDYTFILNTERTVCMQQEITQKHPHEAFVFIKQASYNTTYTVHIDNTAYTFTTKDGLAPSDQPADTLSSIEIANALATQINGQASSNQHTGAFKGTFNGSITGEYLIPGHEVATEGVITWVPDEWQQRTMKETFYGEASGTFEGTATSATLTGTFPVLTFTSTPHVTRWRNTSFVGTFQGDVTPPLHLEHPDGSFLVDVSHSTLWIRRRDGGAFAVRAEDSRSNTHITAWNEKVQNFSDLPLYALHKSVVEVTGNSASTFDNYYVCFEADNGYGMGKGVWKETVKPGVPYKLDPSTLPHALIRQQDGTFTFGPAVWGERTCGDETSSPVPSFVDRTLSGMFLYRNRLAFLSWENVIMSKVGEFFSFFPSTVTTMVDDDPIDVAASHTRPTALAHASVFTGGLLLFTQDAQFTLEHDSVLSSATVSIKPVTEFEASLKAEPVTSGKTVFFATERGKFGGVREYLTLPDQTDQNDAADVSAHIPRYIAGNIHKLICSTNEDVLFVLSAADRSQIWVYKYFWNGAEKIQSAWGRWTFNGKILSGFVRQTTLYLLMKYPDGLYLERMEFEPGHTDEEAAFEFCLDRKVTDASLGVRVAYDVASKLSTVTMPYAIATPPVVVSRRGGKVFPSVTLIGNKAFTVKGNVTNTPLLIGTPYMSTYTFSTFAIRERENSNAVLSGRLQLRSAVVACNNTGLLNVRVAPHGREPSVHTFTARELGHFTNILGDIPLHTGTVKIPILSVNNQVSITVESSSHLPFALVNVTWEGFYNTRNQRV